MDWFALTDGGATGHGVGDISLRSEYSSGRYTARRNLPLRRWGTGLDEFAGAYKAICQHRFLRRPEINCIKGQGKQARCTALDACHAYPVRFPGPISGVGGSRDRWRLVEQGWWPHVRAAC